MNIDTIANDTKCKSNNLITKTIPIMNNRYLTFHKRVNVVILDLPLTNEGIFLLKFRLILKLSLQN